MWSVVGTDFVELLGQKNVSDITLLSSPAKASPSRRIAGLLSYPSSRNKKVERIVLRDVASNTLDDLLKYAYIGDITSVKDKAEALLKRRPQIRESRRGQKRYEGVEGGGVKFSSVAQRKTFSNTLGFKEVHRY
ncbi:hypothetical protein BV898_00735 [Hypsibius exemplaris]|uniref:Uncharacterized protein n=1 Tax=Hypsibius exemplaris TaxID=2072580 RepID=A0A1W0XEA3_HYPEX|nr:hypothetical protein BV898_00735 [Hypsibius exemplaris]